VQVGSDAELAGEREDGRDRGFGISVESRYRADELRTRLDRGDEALSILYAERRPLYLAADATVQTLGKSIPEVAGEVARWLVQD